MVSILKLSFMPLLRPLMLILILCSALQFFECFVLSSPGCFVMEIASRSNEFLTELRDLGFGFLLLGSFWRTLNALGALLMFAFGVKILKFRSKSKGFIQSESKRSTAIINPKPKLRITEENGNEEEEKESSSEKDESDVKTLRKMVKNERRRRKKAVAELEKERMAAATAAEEAMAMILRVQREKSVIEIQANQERRVAEQRQQYDHQVIRYLERIAMDYEQKSWGKKVEMGMEEGESEGGEDSEKSCFSSTMEDLQDDTEGAILEKESILTV